MRSGELRRSRGDEILIGFVGESLNWQVMRSEVLNRIEIVPYENKHLGEILRLTKRSISTTRTPLTWQGNHMTGVLAFYENNLVGAIPLEPRQIALGNNHFFKVVWVSGAHVDPSYRSMGIGSLMEKKITEVFSTKVDGIFVYRGEQESGAFKWYQKNGYKILNSIVALEKPVGIESNHYQSYDVISKTSEIREFGTMLESAFLEKYKNRSGYVMRSPQYWVGKVNNHLYKAHYSYTVITVSGISRKLAYAFLGETSIGDRVHRLDIFEFVAISEERENLLDAIINFSSKKKIPMARIRFVRRDNDIGWFFEQGFKLQSEFFLKARFLNDKVHVFSNRNKKEGMSNVAQIPVQKLRGIEYGARRQIDVSERKCNGGSYSSNHTKYVSERNYDKLTGLEGDSSSQAVPGGACLTGKHSASYFHSDYI